MTWSISTGGTKATVLKFVEAAEFLAGESKESREADVFKLARELIRVQLSCIDDDPRDSEDIPLKILVSASGHRDGLSIHVSMTQMPEPDRFQALRGIKS